MKIVRPKQQAAEDEDEDRRMKVMGKVLTRTRFLIWTNTTLMTRMVQTPETMNKLSRHIMKGDHNE